MKEEGKNSQNEPRMELPTRPAIFPVCVFPGRDVHSGDDVRHEEERRGVCELFAWTSPSMDESFS